MHSLRNDASSDTVRRRHGKFRPTLMKLVTSNDPGIAKDTVQQSLGIYREKSCVPDTINELTKLRGIGPATASLLLAVHDPNRVIFFSDEAFYWLCCDGQKSPIKYNVKEYNALRSEAEVLAERLQVSTTDIEKVAYVVMRQPVTSDLSTATARILKPTKPKAVASPAKRKPSSDGEVPVRRSKRSKA